MKELKSTGKNLMLLIFKICSVMELSFLIALSGDKTNKIFAKKMSKVKE